MIVKYCSNCVMPSTKPNSIFLNGICKACLYNNNKKIIKINWFKRKTEFNKIISQIKKNNKSEFDVLVPVSGGKDSLTQIHHTLFI